MPSHDLTRETIEIQEFPHLVGIPRRQNYFVPAFSQLVNDRNKEGDMWGIINIDPNSSWSGYRLSFLSASDAPKEVPISLRLSSTLFLEITRQKFCWRQKHRDRF
jgi:hypothetical protein